MKNYFVKQWTVEMIFTLNLFFVTIISTMHNVAALSVRRSTDPEEAAALKTWESEEMSVPRRPKITGETVEQIELTSESFDLWLECEFQGNPTPQPFWLKNSNSVPNNYEIKTDLNKGTTAIQIPAGTLNVDEKSNYTCIASNFLGSATKTFILTPIMEHKRQLPTPDSWWT